MERGLVLLRVFVSGYSRDCKSWEVVLIFFLVFVLEYGYIAYSVISIANVKSCRVKAQLF